MATSKIDILINAKNNASAAIKAVKGDLSGMDKEAGGATSGLGKLALGFTALGVAAGALKLAQTTFELGKLAATGLRVSDSFQTIASEFGTTSDKMLGDMRRAMMGQVSNTELMVAANRAILTGAAQSAEDMTRILEVANARSNAMGISTTESMGRMVDAIARLDPTLLQSLGIIIDSDRMYAAYAQTLNKTAAELTQAEKRAALLNETVRQTQPLNDAASSSGRDLAGDFEALDTSITNAKQALGELFAPAAAAIAENLAESVDKVTQSLIAMNTDMAGQLQNRLSEIEQLSGAWRLLVDLSLPVSAAPLDAQAAAMPQIIDMLNKMDVATRANVESAGIYREELNDIAVAAMTGALSNEHISRLGTITEWWHLVAAGATEAASSYDTMTDATNGLTSAQIALQQTIRDTIAELREVERMTASATAGIKSSFIGAVGKLGATGALSGYKEMSAELVKQTEQWKSQGILGDELLFKQAEFVHQVQSANSELGKTVRTTAKIPEHVKEAQRAAEEMQRAFDNLTGQIGGLINQSLNIGVGVDPDSFLPREDAINEDARRLADVMVNGFASPWASYFEQEFPSLWADLASGGDIQQSAARVLQEFQKGLRPELMDREAIKSRIRQMLIGDENTQRLAQEIAQELSSELGISLQQANSAAKSVLGTGGSENMTGNAFGDGFVGAVADNDYGAQAVEVLVAQLDGNEAKIKTAGGRHGRWYGGNFLETFGGSVPNGVLDILVDLITPGVLARVAGLQTQTGTVD